LIKIFIPLTNTNIYQREKVETTTFQLKKYLSLQNIINYFQKKREREREREREAFFLARVIFRYDISFSRLF